MYQLEVGKSIEDDNLINKENIKWIMKGEGYTKFGIYDKLNALMQKRKIPTVEIKLT